MGGSFMDPGPRLTLGPAPPGVLPPIPDVTLKRPSILGPAEGATTLDGFEFAKAELTSSHVAKLEEMAEAYRKLLAQNPAGKVKAVGHTDAVGAEADNDALGQHRADAVRGALVGFGIDAGSIDTHSLGEAVPEVETKKKEAKNRRVELYFSPGASLGLEGIFTGGLKPPQPLGPVEVPNISPHAIDYCKIFPEKCDPNHDPLKNYKPIPPAPGGQGKSFSESVWGPIDKSLEKGLRGLGLSDKWNERLRDAAKAGAQKGVEEGLDASLDAAGATGKSKDAASAALRAAAQLRIPF
jgi:hypothetical protein